MDILWWRWSALTLSSNTINLNTNFPLLHNSAKKIKLSRSSWQEFSIVYPPLSSYCSHVQTVLYLYFCTVWICRGWKDHQDWTQSMLPYFEYKLLVRTVCLIHFPSFVSSVRKQPFPKHCFWMWVFSKILFQHDTFSRSSFLTSWFNVIL